LQLIRRFILLCLFCGLAATGALVRADELHLKDGRVLEADEVWELGNEVWFRQGKVTASVARSEVLRLVRPKPTATAKPTMPTTPGAAEANAKAAPAKKRVAARIILKAGTIIDADTAWEDGEHIGYRLGQMQAFIERAAISEVLRDVVVGEPSGTSRADARFTTGHAGLDQLIAQTSARHDLDPLLVYLVMREESGFNYRAVSRAGARGLMQLMPGTAARLGVRNIHDPVENVEAGTRYLKNLIQLFSGDVNLALAAYNAGEAAVLRYGRRVPPYRETQSYVRRINAAYRRAIGYSETAAN
jgi:hypothetical protein